MFGKIGEMNNGLMYWQKNNYLLYYVRNRGKYMGIFAPYGYKKSEKDHNRLLLDEEAADGVRLIFEQHAG